MVEEEKSTIEEERRHEPEEFSERSASQLVRELLRLVFVLIWRFIVWLFKRFLKGVLWCIQVIETGLKRLNDWWHDNDTQEKVAKIKAWLKMAAKTFGRWCVIAAKATAKGTVIAAQATWHGIKIGTKATGKGIVIGAKATVQGILHLRTTLKKTGKLIAQGARATAAWMKRCRRGMKLSRIRRKRYYQEFKRKGGMKGMIVNTSRNVKNSIEMFMEEDQEEATPDAVTEDDLMEEAIEERANEGKRPVQIGKSIFSHAKSFMDVE